MFQDDLGVNDNSTICMLKVALHGSIPTTEKTAAGFFLNGVFMYLLFKPHKLHDGIYTFAFRWGLMVTFLQKVEVF